MNNEIHWAPGVTLKDIEKQTVRRAFDHFRGNKTQTSVALGISIRTLDTRLDELKADDEAMIAQQAKLKLDAENFLRRQRGIPALEQQASQVNWDDAQNLRDVVAPGFPPEPAAVPTRPAQNVSRGRR